MVWLMTASMNDAVRRLLDEPNHAVLGTVNRDGSPQTSVVWVGRDGDDVLISTAAGRRKDRNMRRDPRVSLLVHALPGAAGEVTYAVISGTVEFTDDPDGSFHQVMYDLHMGGSTPPPEPGAVRLIARLSTQHIYAPPSYSAST